MIDNHLNKVLEVFDVMSSLLANFYYCKHFLLVNFIISFRDRHFSEKQDHRTLLIIDFFELRKHFCDDEVWDVRFYYWLVVEFIMTQHWYAHENSFERFHRFDLLWNEHEFDFELVFFVSLQKRRQIDWCSKKVVHEMSIKIRKFDKELYVFIRFE
jgi:hypothetical protein